MSIRAILYNPNTREASEATINSYKDYYPLLECTTFDVVSFPKFDVYVDDEGLMKRNILTQIDGSDAPYAGNLVFTGGIDKDGETTSLPKKYTTQVISDLCMLAGYI